MGLGKIVKNFKTTGEIKEVTWTAVLTSSPEPGQAGDSFTRADFEKSPSGVAGATPSISSQ